MTTSRKHWVSGLLVAGLGLLAAGSGCVSGSSGPGGATGDPPTGGPALGVEECDANGGQVILDPGDGSTYREGCPGGRAFLGPVDIGIEGGICCQVPPVLQPEECTAQGGQVILDPGDGSTHRDGCPDGRGLLGAVRIGIEGGICCEPLPVLQPEECTAQGGKVIGDPGDGSTFRNGCPDGREMLGAVRFGIEGGICCALKAHGGVFP